MILRTIGVITLILSLTACERLAAIFTPKKQAISSHSKFANQAEDKFWQVLHSGSYEKIEDVNRILTAAYLQNPNDPTIAAHLGFLHIWKITERGREKVIAAPIANEIILSKKYFSDAVELNPYDPRMLGFLGDSQLAEGKIFHDERQQVHGYFTIKRAISAWPQFNYFTGGYVMSTLSPNSKQFREGLEWQWRTMDICAHQTVDRSNPTYRPFMHLETMQGPDRACWNSWIAPYNFEGFFLNMGDMLVKYGDWQTATRIYQNAKLAKNYSTWPYRSLLENRITHAKENVANFRKNTVGSPDKTYLFNSGYGCVACHQAALEGYATH